jgi:hypothetical protein
MSMTSTINYDKEKTNATSVNNSSGSTRYTLSFYLWIDDVIVGIPESWTARLQHRYKSSTLWMAVSDSLGLVNSVTYMHIISYSICKKYLLVIIMGNELLQDPE